MGPLYGSFFSEMGEACAGVEDIDAEVFGRMLDAGHTIIVDIGEARVGDKTLLDTLLPAVAAFHASVDAGDQFPDALDAMVQRPSVAKSRRVRWSPGWVGPVGWVNGRGACSTPARPPAGSC